MVGSEVFVYTMQVAFSGLEGDIVSGTVEDFFPSTIQYELPPLGGFLDSIEEVAEGDGTRLIFSFSNLSAGTTVEFTIGAYFGEGRRDGDTFSNTATLKQEGEEDQSVTAETVTLSLTPQFSIRKYSGESTPDIGEPFYFYIVLENYGDLGGEITNIQVIDSLPDGLVPFTGSDPVGYDTSASFPDTTYDGLTATWETSGFTFNLPSFAGQSYTIQFQVEVDLRVAAGTVLSNVVNWWVNSVFEGMDTASVVTYEDKAEGKLAISGGYYAMAGEEFQYALYHGNNGTVSLSDYSMAVTLPTEFSVTEIRTTSSTSSMAEYSLYMTSSADPETLILLAENISGNSDVIDLSVYLSDDEQVGRIFWESTEALVYGGSNVLYLQGTVAESTAVDTEISLTANLTATSTLEDVDLGAEKISLVANRSLLQISKAFADGASVFNPLSEFTLELSSKPTNGNTVNPVFADLLPTELSYVAGGEYYQYDDFFTGETYDSREDDFPLALPTITEITDYEGTGQTLIRFSFDEVTLLYLNELRVYFDVLVNLDANSSFSNVAYFGNPSDDGIVSGTAYVDVLDMDGDGYTQEEIAVSTSLEGTILYTSAFSIEKWVKGNLDLEESKVGLATQGGEVVYQLYVTDNQESSLTSLDVVDILPYVGDTGVILVDESRGSAFSVNLSQEVTAVIVNILTGEVKEGAEISIFYSDSTDPERFDASGNIIGTGTWSTEIPENLVDVASIRVTTEEIMSAYERLLVTITAVTPVDVPVGAVAYNSFAVEGVVINGEETSTLLPTEPNQVSLTIVGDSMGSIGDFVWNDLNQDGIFDDDEVGINGVTVELYDSEETLLATTISGDNFEGEAGYYLFGDLVAGDYYVKFIPLEGYQLTTQVTEESLGSKPDPNTGFTVLISLGEGEEITDILAGVYETAALTQAINDIITSVALEEAGIKGILDAEGAKIQKAVALGLSTADLIAVNDSVESMVKAITELEEVLAKKLTIVVD